VAPVLVHLNYDTAELITVLLKSSDDSLMVMAVDSCTNGAGWVVYQFVEEEKHPVMYGSCTFSKMESHYSQPKCELFGVFHALKDLHH
jgi:RNase H-like domain found in reverse transcriptase